MKKFASSVVAVLLLAGSAGAGEAQIWKSYHGCGVWACIWTEWTGYDDGAPGPNVLISTDAFFFAPDGLGGTLPAYWTRFVTYYEPGWAGYADYGVSDPEPPSYWVEDVRYGPIGLEWPEGEMWAETIVLKPTVTPEPASLLLLAGGLAGVGAARRKRSQNKPHSA